MAVERFEVAWLKVEFDPGIPDGGFAFRGVGVPALTEAEAIRLARWITGMVTEADRRARRRSPCGVDADPHAS